MMKLLHIGIKGRNKMYNKEKVKQLAKAMKKSVKQTMKEDANHIYVMDEFWTCLEELLNCDYCPCAKECNCVDYGCDDNLKRWYNNE